MAFRYRTVSTITFYQGVLPKNYLSQRVHSIVEANPWLSGYLEKESSGIWIKYPTVLPSPTEIERRHLKFIEDPALNENFEFRQYNARYNSLLVKTGKECLGKHDEYLFRVIAIKISEVKFALICSLSHVLGDGFTFYSIYGMLSQSVSPYSLQRYPISDFENRSKELFKGSDVDDMQSFQFAISMMINLIKTSLFKPPFRPYLYYLEEEWIAREKKAAVMADPSCTFVSTNDILMSWFCRLVQSDFAMMAANLRDRLPGLDKMHAGNYQVTISYQPADYASPTLIRKSLQDKSNIGRVVSGPLPGPFSFLLGDLRIALTTNWSTFYLDLELQDCEQIIHFPIIGRAGGNPISDGMIIFRPNKGKLAVFVATRSCSDALMRSQKIFLAPLLGSVVEEESKGFERWTVWIIAISFVVLAISMQFFYPVAIFV